MIARANPYVGPRSFRTGERLHGRDRELRDLTDLLASERILLLYSPSGAGKTSLIRAGVIPAMRAEGYGVLPVARPGLAVGDEGRSQSGNPYVNRILESWEQEGTPEGEQRLPSVAGIPLSGYLSQRSWVQSEDRLKLIILDQFEEVLTADQADVETKRAFFRELGDALRDPMVWALIAMREEYSAALDAYRHLLPTRLGNRFRLDLLHREEAAEAIARPAAEAGLDLAPETVARLLDDLGTVRERTSAGVEVVRQVPFIEPLYLQIVCHRLWKELPDDAVRVTPAMLDATGVDQVADALEHYYASVVEAVARETTCSERSIREWLENELVTPQGLRRQVLRGERETAGMANAVVLALERRSLLRGDARAGTEWFEITHDRLAAVVRDGNAKWYGANLQPFQIRGAQWIRLLRSGMDASRETLSGAELKGARAWAQAHPEAVSPVDREFLTASKASWVRRRREKWLKAAVAFTVIVGAVLFGLFQRNYAARLERQSAREHSRSLLAEAANQRWVQYDNELAVLLALQSQRSARQYGVREDLGPWGEQQLRTMVQARPFAFSVRLGDGAFVPDREIALTRSGRLAALQTDERAVRVRPTEEGRGSAWSLDLDVPLVALAFTSDDQGLDVYTERGMDRYASEGGSDVPIYRILTDTPPLGVACETETGQLFLATQPGDIEVWDLGTDVPARLDVLGADILAGDPDARFTALLCEPCGNWLAWGTNRGELGLVDLREGRRSTVIRFRNVIDDWPEPLRTEFYFRRAYLSHAVKSLHLLPDGYLLFALYAQGPPRILDLSAGLTDAVAAYLLPDDDSAAALRIAQAAGRATRQVADPERLINSDISRDGKRIAVGGQRSTIGWWDMDSLSLDPNDDPPLGPLEPGQTLYARYAELPGLGGALRTLRLTDPRAKEAVASRDTPSTHTWLAAADLNANLRWWSLGGFSATGEAGYRPEVAGVVYGLAFLNQEGTRLAYGGSQGSGVLHIDPQTGRAGPESGIALPHYTRALAVSGDLRRMVIATADIKHSTGRGWVKEDWERRRYSWLLEPLTPAEGQERRATVLDRLHTAGQWAAGASADGNLLLTAGWDGVVGLYDHTADAAGDWKTSALGPLKKPGSDATDPIRSAALRPDGRHLAAGTQHGQVVTFQGHGTAFEPAETLLQTGVRIDALAYSPDGDWMTAGDHNGVLWTWHREGGRYALAVSLQAHRDAIYALTYSTEGRLVSGAADGGVYLWESGKPDLTRRLRLTGARNEVQSVAVSEQGKRLAAGTAGGEIRLWDLDLENVIAQACAGMFRNLTWEEWQRYVGKERYQCTCGNLPPARDVPEGAIDQATCPTSADAMARP